MDWSAVTAEDLVDALREVDWSMPPRPVPEFFSRFTVPRSYSKWTSRLKCNLYYYRTNYFILIMFILGMGFLWKPVAILSACMTGISIAFLNDSFAVTFNEKVTRTVRQFSPHLAAKMRPPITPVLRGRPSSKRSIHICGRPRWVFVLLFSGVSCMLWLTSCSLLTVLWALLIALLERNSEQFGGIIASYKAPLRLSHVNVGLAQLYLSMKVHVIRKRLVLKLPCCLWIVSVGDMKADDTQLHYFLITCLFWRLAWTQLVMPHLGIQTSILQ